MKTGTYDFVEVQKFRQKWLWGVLIGICILLGVLKYYVPSELNQQDNWVVLLPLILILILFFTIRMTTKINKEGIYVKFTPFHLSARFYRWDEIEKCYIREYHPIREYGGWGIRRNFSGDNKAFNVSGNKGLQLEFKNGNKLLIGTNNMDKLSKVLVDLNVKY